MEQELSSISVNDFNNTEDNELKTLFSEGQLWSRTQEVLEEQALKELEIFVTERNENKLNGINPSSNSECEIKVDNTIFNIENYIKKQEELKKRTCDKSKKLQLNKETTLSISNNKSPINVDDDSIRVQDYLPNCMSIDKIHDEIKQGRTCSNKRKCHFTEYDNSGSSGSEYIPSEIEFSDEDYQPNLSIAQNKTNKKVARGKDIINKEKVKDDALLHVYKARLDQYYETLEKQHIHLGLKEGDNVNPIKDKVLKHGLKVPTDLWNKLYGYQQEGIKWLWELHQKSTGGLLGDEMGLGKSIQIIVFLHSLAYSRVISHHCRFIGVGPSMIVCPATIIHQWVKYFHEWSPEFRVVILHQSGSHQGNKAKLIDGINKNKGIIITTYAGILKFKGILCEYNWHYLILDEGHKIRNPAAKATVAIKHIRTPHRIMLTGSPMQNNLTELWSLFDFTNPGMLGNLAIFTEHFANPILQGGFANASPMQEATALSVASTLKNIISPYLLRRMKSEVQDHIHLPHKSEQVLFCSLTDEQHDIYKNYLMSEQVNCVLGRGIKNWKSDNFMRANMLIAITALRKICNHPDIYLFDEEPPQNEGISIENKFGYYKRSGKMIVVSALLKIWKKQGHRVLLFSQGRPMIQIFECFLEQTGYKYLKMDGSTSINSRQGIIDKFNHDSTYDIFLLTTKVGGLGVNLTGASRVIIYDPDWNPATDTQARERAWRIGQDKSVTVYRLISAGTIEEKMYQRQVWKQLLSNKILVDPTTNKFFKSSDLFDLFSLPESPKANPETTNIFHDSRVRIQEKLTEEKKYKKQRSVNSTINSLHTSETLLPENVQFSEDKIQAMKNLAQQIAKSLSQRSSESREETQRQLKETSYQKELREQRQKKLQDKEILKKLTPQELIEYNRLKSLNNNEDLANKIDDKNTNVSFEKALEQSAKTANLYNKLTIGKIKEIDRVKLAPSPSFTRCTENMSNEGSNNNKKHKSEKSKNKYSSLDNSRRIDGEEIEGLVKRETKSTTKDIQNSNESQDSYILEHLFSKKGVSGALEHESVFSGGKKLQSLKIRNQAEERGLKSLEALKKSRLNNWKW